MSDRKLIDAAYRNWRESLDDPAFASPTSFEAGYLAALSAPIPRWIPAREKLPDRKEPVVYARPNDLLSGSHWHVGIAYWTVSAKWKPEEESTHAPRGFTHWMPLPEPPDTQPAEQTTINDAGRRETQPIAMTGDVKNDPEASGLNSARESRDRPRRETASAGPASPSAQPAVPDNGRVATTQGSREPESHILRSAHPDPRDAEIAALRKALRKQAIREARYTSIGDPLSFYCGQCGGTWKANRPELHIGTCLAEPARGNAP